MRDKPERYIAFNGHAMTRYPGESSAFAQHASDCHCKLSSAQAEADMEAFAGERMEED